MIAYLVKEVGSKNEGQMWKTMEEAEKQAGYLNDIPDDRMYVVKEVSVTI